MLHPRATWDLSSPAAPPTFLAPPHGVLLPQGDLHVEGVAVVPEGDPGRVLQRLGAAAAVAPFVRAGGTWGHTHNIFGWGARGAGGPTARRSTLGHPAPQRRDWSSWWDATSNTTQLPLWGPQSLYLSGAGRCHPAAWCHSRPCASSRPRPCRSSRRPAGAPRPASWRRRGSPPSATSSSDLPAEPRGEVGGLLRPPPKWPPSRGGCPRPLTSLLASPIQSGARRLLTAWVRKAWL